MKKTAIWVLAAVNVLLLGALVLRLSAAPAFAQQAPASRPGDYLMIPGEIVGGNDAVVYVVSQASRQLSALVYDQSMHQLKSIPPIDLDRLLNSAPTRNGTGSRSRTLQD